jgi:hypothetical protein
MTAGAFKKICMDDKEVRNWILHVKGTKSLKKKPETRVEELTALYHSARRGKIPA